MAYDLIIANGTIISATGQEVADVAIRGERIAAIGKGLAKPGEATRIVDAAGKYVIPGALDVHVHLELPFCGTVSSDDWLYRHAGGGSRGRDYRHRFRHPLWHAIARRRLSRLAGTGQAEGLHRLLLPHGDHQLGSARPRDGEDGRTRLSRPSRSS